MLGLQGTFIVALGATLAAAVATHFLDANYYGGVIAQQQAEASQAAKAVSDAAANAAAANLKTLQDQLDKTNADSEKAYQELLDVQANYTVLQNSVAAGTVRLSIPAYCPSRARGLSDASEAGGLVHDTDRVQLDPATAQSLVAITTDGDQAITKLKACQQFILDITEPRK